jgi:hypothetical protein
MAPRRDRSDTSRPRGRPTKFGRPSKLVALTLPLDTLAALRRIDPDPARAVVALVQDGHPSDGHDPEPPLAELVQLTARHAMIVVNSNVIGSLPGVSILPLDAGRAFLALEPGGGLSDLEVAVQDRLDAPDATPVERAALQEIKTRLRAWRQSAEMRFEPRAIIVATRARGKRAPRKTK